MKELKITKNDAGQRLDRFVAKALPLLPDSLLQKYIRLKRIKLNGKGAKRDERLKQGDVLQLYIADEFFERPNEKNAYLKLSKPRLDIIYEDENILLVDKPSGVLCHSGGKQSQDSLVTNIQAHCYLKGQWRPREENSFAPSLCNRIDRNTGGIVIAAKNAEALRIINEKIKKREIDKYYLCAVVGKPRPPKGILEDYIFKDRSKNQVFIKDADFSGAKLAATEYNTLVYKNGLSLVECRLITGRTHQIRAQMANIGTPLLGDLKYGVKSENQSFGEKGQALYSYKISFDFKSPAGALDYLSGRCFSVSKVDFAEKYFDFNISVDK
jgi:23S rRNA pseudouridine955/2504/2580 synthase